MDVSAPRLGSWSREVEDMSPCKAIQVGRYRHNSASPLYRPRPRRRQEFKPLLYAAIAGISLSAYELLQYPIIGLAIGDQLLAMAVLATLIMYCYRLLTPG
jgi:hypothetical protein